MDDVRQGSAEKERMKSGGKDQKDRGKNGNLKSGKSRDASCPFPYSCFVRHETLPERREGEKKKSCRPKKSVEKTGTGRDGEARKKDAHWVQRAKGCKPEFQLLAER